MSFARRRLFVCCLAAAIIAGCGNPPKEYFYTLTGGAPATVGVVSNTPAAYRVAIGPVTLPELVDRPQLVVHTSAQEVAILEQHRWAEPLKSAIPRVIAADLVEQLGASASAFPQADGSDANFAVRLDIARLDAELGSAVTIEALWSVHRISGGEPKTGRSVIRAPADGGYDALVSAHDRALAGVSRDIADAIRSFGPSGNP